jgi:PII-like signaling protein
MQGYQLTFFTEQNRKHGHQPICEWLLKFAEEHGASGGTLMTGAEGFDHAGKFHSAGFFELADQPVAVTVSVDEQVYQGLMDALAVEDVDLSYVKVPVEFGRVGRSVA